MFGNKKRIGELERQVEILINSYGRLRGEIIEILPLTPVTPCNCESCGVNTNGETADIISIPGFMSHEVKTPIKISAAKAIEKIMEHLGLEFDHIEATNPDTVIKPKETP